MSRLSTLAFKSGLYKTLSAIILVQPPIWQFSITFPFPSISNYYPLARFTFSEAFVSSSSNKLIFYVISLRAHTVGIEQLINVNNNNNNMYESTHYQLALSEITQ